MLRIAAGRVGSAIRGTTVAPRAAAVGLNNIRSGHGGPKETDEEFDNRYEAFFNRPDIDHWEIRSAMNRLAGKKKTISNFSHFRFFLFPFNFLLSGSSLEPKNVV